MVDMTKDGRIKREKARLRRQFKEVGKEKLTTVDKLVDRVAFLTITLEDLEETMNLEGCISEYKNGENQWGTKRSPEADLHIAMSKNFLAAMKQLLDLLPDEDGGDRTPHDPVKDFIERR